MNAGLRLLFPPLFHFGVRLFGSIVKRSEPFIPGHFEVPVIALEITVMHLVMERPESETVFVPHNQSLKSRMGGRSGQRLVLHVEENVNGMCGKQPVNQDGTEKHHMLDRMH